MHDTEQVMLSREPDAGPPNAERDEKLKRKDYEREVHKLQVKLCHLQDWVKRTGGSHHRRVRGP